MFKKLVAVFTTFIFLTILVVGGIVGCAGNQKLVGKTFAAWVLTPCTMVSCEDCCNQCGGPLCLLTNSSDTIILKGKDIHCRGTDCELRDQTMHCDPFELGKEYELTGKFEKLDKNKMRTFKVRNFRQNNSILVK